MVIRRRLEPQIRSVFLSVAAVIVGIACFNSSFAQTIVVQLLDAKTGRPLEKKNITFRWNPDYVSTSIVVTGKGGVGHVSVPPGAVTLTMSEGPRAGAEPYRIAYIDCNDRGINGFQISEILKNGVIPTNKCGSQQKVPRPGEIVFWALPRHWWQPDFQ
jgi:hypothetical protein